MEFSLNDPLEDSDAPNLWGHPLSWGVGYPQSLRHLPQVGDMPMVYPMVWEKHPCALGAPPMGWGGFPCGLGAPPHGLMAPL